LLQKLFRNRRNEDYNTGIALYNEGRYEEAIEHFEAAVSEASETSTTYRLGVFYAAEAHANIGRALLKAERYEEACTHFENALQENPNFPDLHYNLGVGLYMGGRVEEALPFFGKALEINPDYIEARCFLAVTQHALGEETEARLQLKEVADRRSEIPIQVNPFLLVNLKERETVLPEIGPVLELLDSSGDFRDVYSDGVTQFNIGRYELAADLLERAAGLKPHYADIQCQYGLARFKCGQDEEAIAAFRGALAINPRFVEAAYFLGATLLRSQRHMEAEEALGFAHDLNPEAPDVLFHLAQCRFHLGKPDEADDLLSEVLARRPRFAPALYLQGLVRYSAGRHGEGIELVRDALSENPYLSAAELDLALMYMKQGELESAEDIFRRLSGFELENANLHCFMGQTRLARGELDEALSEFERAMALEPDNIYALKGRLRCELRLGRQAKAQALLAPYLEKHPDYPDLRKLQGDVHFRGGDFESAEADYREALERSPNFLEARLGLALALRNLGRSKEAEEILRELADAHPENVELRKLLGDHFQSFDELP